jgi:L,D-transpeptidase ErfK/SrfK
MVVPCRILEEVKAGAAAIVFALCAVLSPITNDPALGQPAAWPLKPFVGGQFTYVVQRGDSLTSIGARFGVDIHVLAATNGLSSGSWLREGRSMRIDNRHIIPDSLSDGILINIPQRMLYLFRQGTLARAYPVGLGRPDWPTPQGSFKVISKENNPVWDVPKSIQEEMRREGKIVQEHVPPCPENPLGKHWMGLSIPGFGIHGTIAPASIYLFQTHGCIRLHPDDIGVLFEEVTEGAIARFIYRRVIVARTGDRVFLEVHPDVYRKQPDALGALRIAALAGNFEPLLDWEKAKAIITRQEGIAREITKKAGSAGDPEFGETRFDSFRDTERQLQSQPPEIFALGNHRRARRRTSVSGIGLVRESRRRGKIARLL